MSDYAVTFARTAEKELAGLAPTILTRVLSRIEALAREPRPAGCLKLKGERHLWRIRIGDYRVVYAVFDERRIVDIVAVRHRSDVYR